MSVEAISWALSMPIQRSSTKFVLVALANCANSDMECWPSIKYLCDATSQDRKTVLENIKRLIALGLVEDTDKKRGTTMQVHVYRLVQKESQKRNSPENGTVPKTDGNSTVFPIEQSRFSAETVPKTGHGTIKEPSIEPKEPNTTRETLFDVFWAMYPKKVGKDAAAKAFAKREFSGEQMKQVLSALKTQSRSPQWTKDGGQFIPNPATWLNQGRWMDEGTAVSVPTRASL